MDVRQFLVNERHSSSFDLLKTYFENRYYKNIKLNNKKTTFITKNKLEQETSNVSNYYTKFKVTTTHDVLFGCEVYAKKITKIDLVIAHGQIILNSFYNIKNTPKNNISVWEINFDQLFSVNSNFSEILASNDLLSTP